MAVISGEARFSYEPEPVTMPADSSAETATRLYLSWLRGEHNDSWELAYGPAVADPDSFAVVDCNDIRCTLQGLTPGTKYAARVRGVCFNDSVYSDWSDTIQFHVAEYNPPIGDRQAASTRLGRRTK